MATPPLMASPEWRNSRADANSLRIRSRSLDDQAATTSARTSARPPTSFRRMARDTSVAHQDNSKQGSLSTVVDTPSAWPGGSRATESEASTRAEETHFRAAPRREDVHVLHARQEVRLPYKRLALGLGRRVVRAQHLERHLLAAVAALGHYRRPDVRLAALAHGLVRHVLQLPAARFSRTGAAFLPRRASLGRPGAR